MRDHFCNFNQTITAHLLCKSFLPPFFHSVRSAYFYSVFGSFKFVKNSPERPETALTCTLFKSIHFAWVRAKLGLDSVHTTSKVWLSQRLNFVKNLQFSTCCALSRLTLGSGEILHSQRAPDLVVFGCRFWSFGAPTRITDLPCWVEVRVRCCATE